MALPQSLLASFEKFIEYPTNLEFEPDSTEELLSYRERLNNSTQPTKVIVHFLDIYCSQNLDQNEAEVTSDLELRWWLERGIKLVVLPHLLTQRISQPTAQTNVVLKKDPKCRFIFLQARNSRSPLRVSHQMLARILTHHQVMAGFVDFTSVFGTQAESRGQRFCGFKTKVQLSSPSVVEQLGRSGKYYQICYNLRSVGKSLNSLTIRQAVVHHQFDVVEGTSLWITAKGDSEIRTLISKAVEGLQKSEFEDTGKSFAFSLSIHMQLSQWCTVGWLKYIEDLESKLETLENRLEPLLSGQLPGIPIDDPLRGPRDITLADLSDVQFVERKSNEALMTLEANMNILSSLRDFYSNILDDDGDLTPAGLGKYEKPFCKALKNRESELQRFATRCKRLMGLAADQRNLVIKQLEFQSSKRMENLSHATHALGLLAQREAVAVRIITIVSLIYLPCSVVSSVFSTDIVKYQGSNGSDGTSAKGQSSGTSFSPLALQRWLEVTLPLTFMTLFLGFIGYHFEKWRQNENIVREMTKMAGEAR